MHRDMDLVRTILKTVDESRGPVKLDELVDPAHDFDTVAYHIEIMEQAGLIDAKVVKDWGGNVAHAVIRGLTWAGSDFLDNVRNDGVWIQTKKRISDTVKTASFDLIKATAEMLAKKYIGL